MRARFILQLIGIGVMIALTAIGMRSCSSSSASSPLDPSTVRQNGLAGLCADAQATASASGDGSAVTLQIPAQADGLSNIASASGLTPGSYSCSTTTVAGG